MDIELWMEKARKSIQSKVKVEQKFETRKLFETVEWEQLSIGDRIHFGKAFANAVREGLIPNVEKVQKGENNHAQYIKTKEK